MLFINSSVMKFSYEHWMHIEYKIKNINPIFGQLLILNIIKMLMKQCYWNNLWILNIIQAIFIQDYFQYLFNIGTKYQCMIVNSILNP